MVKLKHKISRYNITLNYEYCYISFILKGEPAQLLYKILKIHLKHLRQFPEIKRKEKQKQIL